MTGMSGGEFARPARLARQCVRRQGTHPEATSETQPPCVAGRGMMREALRATLNI